jgi:hypothetical protein
MTTLHQVCDATEGPVCSVPLRPVRGAFQVIEFLRVVAHGWHAGIAPIFSECGGPTPDDCFAVHAPEFVMMSRP